MTTVSEIKEQSMLMPLETLMACLPYRTDKIEDTAMLGRATGNKGWSCVYRDIVCIEPTPKEAIISMLEALGVLDDVKEKFDELSN